MFEVRRQLLYVTSGTLAASADFSALYIVVFKTPPYSKTIAAENVALRVRITLHWARYQLAVGSEVLLQPEDLGHPQTWELLLHAAEAHHGKQTPAAWARAARM